MDFNKNTFWIVFTIAIAIVVVFFTVMLYKLFSVEDRVKDYIYQNEEIKTSFLEEIKVIKNDLGNINNYLETNKITIK